MPFNQVNIFTNAGYTWRVYADYDNRIIQTVNDPDPQITGPTVDASILGFADGATMTQVCLGTTLVTVVADFDYPYAQFSADVENSPTCGYTPPVCTLSFTTAVLPATNGGNNGSITITAAYSGTLLYSLDGYSFQTSNVFNGLFPGTYNVFLKEFLGAGRTKCRANGSVVVGNTVVDIPASTFPIPYKDGPALCFKFRLMVAGNNIDIREPIRWDAVEITGERDMELHGWEYKYTDGEVTLRFACPQGSNVITEVYDQYGQDGDIGFQFYYIYEGEEYNLFKGRLMLNKYEKLVDSVKCTVEAEQFDSILLSRLETKVSMTQTTTFDGSDVTPPQPYDLTFHAKEILAQFLNINPDTKFYSDFTRLESTVFSILPDLSVPTVNDILDSNTFTLLSSQGIPTTDNLYIHKFTEAGKLNLNLNWPINFTFHVNNGNLFLGGSFDAKIVWIYRAYDALTGTYTETQETISAVVTESIPANSGNDYPVSLTGVKTLTDYNVNIGDEIYFFVFVETNREFTDVSFPSVSQPGIDYTARQLQTAGESQGNVWFLDDAIQHIISCISDNRYVFKSDFFQRAGGTTLVDGQASKRVLTNGFQIRRFDVDEKPLKVDLKTVTASLNAQNCIGMLYRTDAAGNSIVRMERRDYFYRDRQVLVIRELQDYSESVALEFINNEVEIGYKIYQTDGVNSLDEFNTVQTDLTPIKKIPKKLSQVSDLIASGYSIETSRRQQFEETPANSFDNDDNPFIVCVKRESVSEWVTEKNEDFSTVDNVISPDTVYNLRLSPRRMLYNWFIWLKGFLFYKDGTDLIRNTEVVQNGDLITQFNAGATDVIGDINKDLIEEKADLPVSTMADTESIYKPEWVNFRCRLTPDEVQTLNEAMVGLSDNTKNFGYIMVLNPWGVWQAVWPFSLKYNPSTEAATIKGLKKAVSPSEPVENCCSWLVINGCYILVNDNRLIA